MTRVEHAPIDASMTPAEAWNRLDEPVRQLVVAAQVLFGGDWDDLAEDVRRRIAGRPYLFRLELPIDEPLAWIARLKDYERARGERLADAIPG